MLAARNIKMFSPKGRKIYENTLREQVLLQQAPAFFHIACN
jgi:hypothetical protein